MSIVSSLSGMISVKHPTLGILCREDGAVLSRQKGSHPSYKWNYGHLHHSGYRFIHLGKKHPAVHRLIAEAFIPNPENLPEVDHIDRDRQNNSLHNLRWITRKGNVENSNKVIQRDKRITVRLCDNKEEYFKQAKRFMLTLAAPDGSHTMTGLLPQDIYDQLKPLSQRERFIDYHAWKQSLSK